MSAMMPQIFKLLIYTETIFIVDCRRITYFDLALSATLNVELM